MKILKKLFNKQSNSNVIKVNGNIIKIEDKKIEDKYSPSDDPQIKYLVNTYVASEEMKGDLYNNRLNKYRSEYLLNNSIDKLNIRLTHNDGSTRDLYFIFEDEFINIEFNENNPSPLWAIDFEAFQKMRFLYIIDNKIKQIEIFEEGINHIDCIGAFFGENFYSTFDPSRNIKSIEIDTFDKVNNIITDEMYLLNLLEIEKYWR